MSVWCVPWPVSAFWVRWCRHMRQMRAPWVASHVHTNYTAAVCAWGAVASFAVYNLSFFPLFLRRNGSFLLLLSSWSTIGCWHLGGDACRRQMCYSQRSYLAWSKKSRRVEWWGAVSFSFSHSLPVFLILPHFPLLLPRTLHCVCHSLSAFLLHCRSLFSLFLSAFFFSCEMCCHHAPSWMTILSCDVLFTFLSPVSSSASFFTPCGFSLLPDFPQWIGRE